jgi:hypothetical protein
MEPETTTGFFYGYSIFFYIYYFGSILASVLVLDLLFRSVMAAANAPPFPFKKIMRSCSAGRLVKLIWFLMRCINALAKDLFIIIRNRLSLVVVSIYYVNIDSAVINHNNNIPGCPLTLLIERRNDNTLKILVDVHPESSRWLRFNTMKIQIGRNTGRIKSIIVHYRRIRERGIWLRLGCEATEWRSYLGSVVTAHIEVAKFHSSKLSRQPILISRIFKHYSDPIFQEVA